jgi:hypothetical protein
VVATGAGATGGKDATFAGMGAASAGLAGGGAAGSGKAAATASAGVIEAELREFKLGGGLGAGGTICGCAGGFGTVARTVGGVVEITVGAAAGWAGSAATL